MPSTRPTTHDPEDADYRVMRKLPHVTALFWAIKIVAVTLGESAGDLFGITLKIGYLTTEVIFLAYFLVVLAIQLKANRFRPVVFWAVVLGTSMVGTEMSDFLDRGPGHGSAANGVGYGWGAAILTSVLAIIFVIWWRTGQTLDVENIASRKGEVLYWIAILVSNTLGTASGDWLADDTGLGFRNAFLVIAGLMAIILAAHYWTNINTVVLFWLAFVLTRPLGAAGGDALTKPHEQGGLGLGTMWGSAALLCVLAGLVGYHTYDVRRKPLTSLPYPINRRTGQPQEPNGAVVTRYATPGTTARTDPAAQSVDERGRHLIEQPD